jgi:hypothetical protein
MASLYEQAHGTADAPSGATLPPDLSYEVAVPPGYTPETFTKIDQSIASAACAGYGLSESEANPIVAWIVDARHPRPPLPADRGPSFEVAEKSLMDFWGAHYGQMMGQARAALELLDLRRGGRKGELVEAFTSHAAGNHPAVIKEFARLGALMKNDPEGKKLIDKYEKKFADAYAKARGRRPDRAARRADDDE